MSTIPQLFPGLRYKDVRTRPFSTVLTVPLAGPGVFTWNNALSQLQQASPSSVYFVDNITIKFDIDALIVSNSIDQNYNPNGFNFDLVSADGTVLNLNSVTFAGFLENRPLNLFYQINRGVGYSSQNTQQINLRVRGQLIQTPDIILLGKLSISMFIEMDIYEIQNSNWIAENIGGR
jgi:hypothetical protein